MQLGGGNFLHAQTDVTSTYITNPGFEGDYVRFLNINTDRGVEKPVGWSVEWTQSATNDQNGMTYVGSMTQDNQTWSAYEGSKAYLTRMRWANATLNLRQTMTNLRPGSYTLSFYATASKLNDGNGSASVSVAGQSQSITVSTSATTNWTQYTINFTVTTNPYATIEVTASRTGGNFKFGIDNFTLTYDGSSYYSTILTAAQSLYDDNVDWAEGADDLSAAITAATGKETVADKNAAIVSLEEAMATFKEANTVDMTSKITNPNFDSNISGWTTTGGDGNDYQRQTSSQTNFDGGFLEKWRNGWNGGYNQKNFDVQQTLSNLPNGEYTIKAAIIAVMQGSAESFSKDNTAYSNKKHGGPYYIDDNKGVWLYGTSGENSGKAWANTKNNTFDGGGAEYKTATVKVEDGNLTIGFKGIGSESGGTSLGTYANWIACDNWTLSYFGFDPTTLKSQITSLKEEAAALSENSDYSNVIGTERTDLNDVADLTYEDEKKATLEALISTIEGRITAFTTAKSAYDAFVDAKAVEYTNNLPYASATKFAAIGTAQAAADATSATDATAKTNAIISAYRKYVESNALAEGVTGAEDKTLLISDPNFAGVTISGTTAGGWTFDQTGGNANINSNESFTDGEGNSSYSYYDYYNGSNNNQNLHQTIENLEPGRYLLTVTGRGHSNFNGNLQLYVTGKGVVNIPAIGNSGGTFDGGWNDVSLEFEQETTSDITIGVKTNNNKAQWWSATRFRLVKLTVDVIMTVKANKWGTFIAPFDVAIPEGINAYKVTGVEGTSMVKTAVETTIPANTPVVLENTTNAIVNETFYGVNIAEADSYTVGFLTGVYTNEYIPASDETTVNYVLQTQTDEQTQTDVQAFYKVDAAFEATPNRCYISLPVGGGAPLRVIFFDGDSDATGIGGLAGQTAKGNVVGIYSANGTQLNQLQKGLNIVRMADGKVKKVMVK